MRYVYIALIVIVTAIVLVFKIQNLDSVTVSFLTVSITLPVSVLIVLIYVLGMFTGGMVWTVLRSWDSGAAHKEES
jgi:lipopolysaccharide assembly protein A